MRLLYLIKRTLKEPWKKLLERQPRLVPFQMNPPDISNTNQNLHGGKPALRFPPEPNGHLHIGHLKAIRINFQAAKINNGICYLRFDDTNPQNEKAEYQQGILDSVQWLGYQPYRITRASQYQPFFLQSALRLIQQGDAYLCDRALELKQQRRLKLASPNRFNSVLQNKQLFHNFKKGLGKHVIRLKGDPQHPNPTMRDPVIYRLKQGVPRALYDYAHPISDSIQGISHSLCSLQFQIRRELYFFILEKLKLYRPVVWQYSRLNVSGTILSKRKIIALIEQGLISSWDDPRLLTLKALRRLNYKPQTLFKFIDQAGISRNSNQRVIKRQLLDNLYRKQLEKCRRTMAVLQPILLRLKGQLPEKVEQPWLPGTKDSTSTAISVGNQVWIEQNDLKENEKVQNIKKGDIFLLRYLGQFRLEEYDSLSRVACAVKVQQKERKFKKVIHWVSETDAIASKALLLQSSTQECVAQGKQLQILVNKKSIGEIGEIMQFERTGYFKRQKEVWLRVATLKS